MNDKIDLLSTVPCGDQFPSCRFLQDALSSKELVPTAASGLVEISKRIEKVNSSLEDMDEQAITHRIKNFRSLMEKKNTYERALSNLIIEKERSASTLKEINSKI